MLKQLILSKILIRVEENPDLLVLNPALNNAVDGDGFEHFDVDEIEKHCQPQHGQHPFQVIDLFVSIYE